MTIVKDIYEFIDDIAPFKTAMKFDNVGLIVGDINQKVNKVLLALDITNDVVEEAVKLGANLIISHHPVIFNALKKLNTNDVPYMLAKYNINAICAHTNLDISKFGVNSSLAEILGLEDLEPLNICYSENYNKIVVFCPKDNSNVIREVIETENVGIIGNYKGCSFSTTGEGRFTPMEGSNPFIGDKGRCETTLEEKIEFLCKKGQTRKIVEIIKSIHPYEEPVIDIFEDNAVKEDLSLGLIGFLKDEMSAEDFARHVKKCLGCNGVRYISSDKMIKKVAICSGAGGNLIYDAIKSGVDAYVTGEIKYHELLEANKHAITVVDAGHFATEDVVINPLLNILSDKYRNIKFLKSSVLKDIVNYVVN